MKKESWKELFLVTIFSIAMGFLESVIVVYLRKIYYPKGFVFPLVGFIDSNILNIEWFREFCTIVMIVCIGLLVGKKFSRKLAYMVYTFAIWDIFYYVWLKVMLDWPASFFTWDLLFLIPWPWIGPVIAPVLLSIAMIFLAFVIINLDDKGMRVRIKIREWFFLIIGSLIILYTFLYDYGKIIFSGYAKEFFTLANNEQFTAIISSYVPTSYNWLLFIVGLILIVLGIISIHMSNRQNAVRRK